MTVAKSVQPEVPADSPADGATASAPAPDPPARIGHFPPIADLAFLSDGEVAALIAPTGNVEWFCVPRFDSPSVFGALLDRGAGRFRVGPSGMTVPAGRRYVLASMVAETTWMTSTGLLMVRDALTVGPWRAEGRMAEQRRPPADTQAEHVLLRTIKCVHGSVEVIVDCEPVFDYGRVPARWSYDGSGYHDATAHAEDASPPLALRTSLRLGIEGGRATARARLREGDRAFVALAWAGGVPPETVDEAFAALDATSSQWRRWVGSGRFPDHRWRSHLHRSALTLKALTYSPTGAVAAAPTTSLPRVPGGDRNWDLRYSFVRESAWALRALYALGFRWEADDFLSFLVETTSGDRRLQNFVRVNGDDPPEEIELQHLSGYGGARPVRVGNAAVRYAQHDVPGALMDAAVVPAMARRQLPSAVWGMARREVEEVVQHWREPDRGIWALRDEPRHYTTSKVMCWVAVDRGAWLAELRGRRELAAEWRASADAIAADVLAHGVSDRGTFREHYESDDLEASLLVIALVGFLPRHDERVRKTVLAIERDLAAGGLVLRRRARPSDPIVGESVTVCSWWLVAALATIGEVDRARSRAERLLAYASPLGLYAEHLDPASGRQLGNFPHALTHLALIDGLLRLIHAEASQLPEQRARPL
jgi:GH15 family glucan-1,4-alpha-glucosidase